MPITGNVLQKAAEIMVRENKNLRSALAEVEGAEVTSAEASRVERQKSFQKILWAERHKYYNELAADPGLGKAALIGRSLLAVDKLMAEGSWEKACEAVLKLAKIMGLVGPDQNSNIILNLNQRDLDQLREKLATARTGAQPTQPLPN